MLILAVKLGRITVLNFLPETGLLVHFCESTFQYFHISHLMFSLFLPDHFLMCDHLVLSLVYLVYCLLIR